MTAVEDGPLLDFPLQLRNGIVTARIFDRRADQPRLALAKGFLVSLLATIILSVVLWITS